MQNVILAVHILACIVMIGLVLMQRSEGGGLGLGGGGGGGNSLLSGRGAAGALVRSTIIFGAIFFATSLTLTSLANRNNDTRSEVEKALGAEEASDTPAPTDLFDPSSPLLIEEDGAADVAVPEASVTDPVEAPVEPDAGAESDVEEPLDAPETGNPQ